MNAAAKSLFGYGLVMLPIALPVLIAPSFGLGLLGVVPKDTFTWRLIAILALVLGVQNLMYARHYVREIAWVATIGKFCGAAYFAVSAASGSVEPGVLAFGLFDASFATWTLVALLRSRPAPT